MSCQFNRARTIPSAARNAHRVRHMSCANPPPARRGRSVSPLCAARPSSTVSYAARGVAVDARAVARRAAWGARARGGTAPRLTVIPRIVPIFSVTLISIIVAGAPRPPPRPLWEAPPPVRVILILFTTRRPPRPAPATRSRAVLPRHRRMRGPMLSPLTMMTPPCLLCLLFAGRYLLRLPLLVSMVLIGCVSRPSMRRA